jgi:hypothetical protein
MLKTAIFIGKDIDNNKLNIICDNYHREKLIIFSLNNTINNNLIIDYNINNFDNDIVKLLLENECKNDNKFQIIHIFISY